MRTAIDPLILSIGSWELLDSISRPFARACHTTAEKKKRKKEKKNDSTKVSLDKKLGWDYHVTAYQLYITSLSY